MRNALLTTTMLAMFSIVPSQAMAQETSTQEAPAQALPADVVSAYEQYAEAILSFRKAKTEAEAEGEAEAKTEVEVGADAEVEAEAVVETEVLSREAAEEAVLETRENLMKFCESLAVPQLANCLDQFIAPELRVANDLDPLNLEADAMEPAAPAEADPEAMVEGEAAPEAPEAEVQADGQAEEQPAPVENQDVATEETAQDGEAATTTENMDQSATDGTASEQPAEPVEPVESTSTDPEDIAPVLDSAKEDAPVPTDEETDVTLEAEADATSEAEVREEETEAAADAPPPQNDAEAQETATPAEMTSITAEEGERITETEEAEAENARRAPENARVVQQDQSDFRVVFEFGNQMMIESQDNNRLEQDADEIYVEALGDGRTRETIVRADGTEVVTIYNRNGDIIRRSRFTPNGEEQVLVYVDRSYEDDLLTWRDPALDLGPLRLDIPVSEYVLDADEADEDELVQFLDQPPVERVQRLYSINEVKRSARIRDMMRRLEIGGLTFETDKATISPDQVPSLTNVANAMHDMLDQNPAETFLIEGHTDAVGGEIYNLALSDRRAETVAVILSRAFGIPPENLATQGYGERYLKVRTQDADRRNRRVTIKRITPLISPIGQR